MNPKPLDLDAFGIIEQGKKGGVIDSDDRALPIVWCIDEIKQRIKQACEFFMRYKDNPKLLMKEHPEYIEDIRKIQNEWYNWEEHYNEWLFKLAFKDIFGDS